jgi:DNA invertase Pin-like site-specific DNA recombinase
MERVPTVAKNCPPLAGPLRPRSEPMADVTGTNGRNVPVVPALEGRLLSTLLAAIAEFERELIRERTGDGRKRAMAAGVKFGRKPKLSDFQRSEALKRRTKGETLAEIVKSYAVDISTISRL